MQLRFNPLLLALAALALGGRGGAVIHMVEGKCYRWTLHYSAARGWKLTDDQWSKIVAWHSQATVIPGAEPHSIDADRSRQTISYEIHAVKTRDQPIDNEIQKVDYIAGLGPGVMMQAHVEDCDLPNV